MHQNIKLVGVSHDNLREGWRIHNDNVQYNFSSQSRLTSGRDWFSVIFFGHGLHIRGIKACVNTLTIQGRVCLCFFSAVGLVAVADMMPLLIRFVRGR